MELVEQLFRADLILLILRMWMGLITMLLIINVIMAFLNSSKKSRKLMPKRIQKHFGKIWLLLNIGIIGSQIFFTVTRYQERLIPPQEMPESSFKRRCSDYSRFFY